MKKILLCFGLLLSLSIAAIPVKTNKFVNDFAGVISSSKVNALENHLSNYSDSTTNQICVVTVKDLEGLSVADYAQRLGESWGVGQKDKNNGVIILVKPKYSNSKGEVFIATGYGVEGCLPDALCKRIIERKMIPHLKNNNYYQAINFAIIEIEQALSKENIQKEKKESNNIAVVLIFLIIFLVCMIVTIVTDGESSSGSGYNRSTGWYHSSSSSSSYRRSSSSSSTSRRSSSFGGGHFGGGGARGSW